VYQLRNINVITKLILLGHEVSSENGRTSANIFLKILKILCTLGVFRIIGNNCTKTNLRKTLFIICCIFECVRLKSCSLPSNI